MSEKEEEKLGLALLKASDLTKVENTILNAFQLQMLLKKTPKTYIKSRPAKGGGTWDYVSGGYIRKVLNMMFGWDWDFEIKDKQFMFGQVIIEGKLTVRSGGKKIVKEQIGKKEVVFKKGTSDPLDIGNDFKAAATDALKKCAAELGIAADVYNASEFKEIKIDVSEELTPREKSRLAEEDRLVKLIDACEDLISLESLQEHITDSIYAKYNEKWNSLQQDK